MTKSYMLLLKHLVPITREGLSKWSIKNRKILIKDYYWDDFQHKLRQGYCVYDTSEKIIVEPGEIDFTYKIADLALTYCGYGKTLITLRERDKNYPLNWINRTKGHITLMPADKYESSYRIFDKDVAGFKRFYWFIK